MDVNSLYTDMQIVVVKRAVARMVSHNAFDEVIDFICGNNLFTYVGNIYHQLDGIAMGTDASSTSTGNEKDAGITAAAGVAAGSSNRGGFTQRGGGAPWWPWRLQRLRQQVHHRQWPFAVGGSCRWRRRARSGSRGHGRRGH